MLFRATVTAAIVSLCAAAANAAALDPGKAIAAPGDIVVTGNRPTATQSRERAATYVALTGRSFGERPIARWTDPVCPRVLNLETRYAAIVEAKIRAIATEAGIPLARASCLPNVVVTFTPDAGAVVDRIATRTPRRLAEVAAPARVALRTGDAPVRWWYATTTRSRDGREATTGKALWAGGNGQGGGSILPEVPGVLNYGDSLISTQTARVLTAATVVVDIDRAAGRTLDAVASYVAVVALAEIGTDAPSPPGSVLGLFGGDETAAFGIGDRAFLRALYAIPLDRAARQQRGRLMAALTAAQASDAAPH